MSLMNQLIPQPSQEHHMTTTTMTFTDTEMDILRTAIAVQTDMSNDMMMENLTTGLFLKPEESTTINYESAKVLRDELNEEITKMNTLHLLLIRFGGEYNSAGYTT